jgi:type IV pilus assembly protein PilB
MRSPRRPRTDEDNGSGKHRARAFAPLPRLRASTSAESAGKHRAPEPVEAIAAANTNLGGATPAGTQEDDLAVARERRLAMLRANTRPGLHAQVGLDLGDVATARILIAEPETEPGEPAANELVLLPQEEFASMSAPPQAPPTMRPKVNFRPALPPQEPPEQPEEASAPPVVARSEQEIAAQRADQYALPMVDFRSVSPEKDALDLLDESTARTLIALPYAISDDGVAVGLADPSEATIERLRKLIGRPLILSVAAESDVLQAIEANHSALTDVDSHIHAFETRDSLRREAVRLETVSANDDAPVVRVVQMLIAQGLRDRASDIHIEPSGDRVRVRYRVDGALQEVLSLPGSIGPAMVSRIKIIAGMNIVERRRPQDGQMSTRVDNREVDIRVSTTAVVGGEKVVMRLLDKGRPLYDLSKLGMPDDLAARYHDLIHAPYGMVICAGPTGSGKTTTLYASLGELDTPERNLMTIEDPVEYVFPTINQISINEQAGITFAGGLRSILRQDPDVILVGEVRDADTARIAVQSAQTGHLVLSSLHATDSISALHRLLGMGIETFLVAAAVTAVVAQRLVRRNCAHCLEPYEPTAEELAFLATFGGEVPDSGLIHGAGCNFCAHTGFLDRIGVYELMVVTDRVRELVLANGTPDELRALCREEGLRTLQEQSVRLATSGVTTPAEMMRSIYVAGA